MYRNEIYRSTLFAVLAILSSLYMALWVFLGGRVAIEIFNIIVLAFSTGIVVAYLPTVMRAVKDPKVAGGDVLAIGIFLAWLGNGMLARSGSILWRFMDRPPSWLESGWWGLYIDIAAMGAACHLIAPRAVEGRVPPEQWLRFGAAIAAAVFIIGMVFIADF